MAAEAAAGSRLDALILLLLGGALALGLPRLSLRDRLRWWHPWLNEGLLPLVVGLAIGPATHGWFTPESARSLRPLLGLLLTAAGFLAGTQLRATFLAQAGRAFVARETTVSVRAAAVVAIPAAAICVAFGIDAWAALGVSAAAFAALASQRAAAAGGEGASREVVIGRVATAGWWNLVALALIGGALSFGLNPRIAPAPLVALQALVVAGPAALGLTLGWLSAKSRDRADAHLFLLAVLTLGGGLAIASHAVPLFFGFVAGAVFVNVAPTRAGDVERLLDDAEQPLVIGCALFGGLTLLTDATPPWTWAVAGTALVGRWLARLRCPPPASPRIGGARGAFAGPGAGAVLLVATLTLAPPPAPQLAMPMTAAAIVAALVDRIAERSSRRGAA